jgi:hypothetical protein
MRDLTKSLISYGWATSLFGIQQAMNMFVPWQPGQEHPMAKGFNGVSAATVDSLQPPMRGMYDAGENFQRSMVNMFFDVMDPTRWMGMSTQMMDQAAAAGRRATQAGAEAMGPGMSWMGGSPGASRPGPTGL